VLKGGNSFVTERFLENSGFSLEMIVAKRKINESTVRNAKEKFSFLFRKVNLFLKRNIIGIIKKYRSVAKIESIKLKFNTAIAAFELFTNKTI
jgi:hypothetical protein